MGLWLLIASLTMLFGAALVGFLVIRLRAPEWPPPGTPPLPTAVWISTALLAALSAVLVRAERDGRAGKIDRLTRMLVVSDLLATAFLASQVSSWMRLVAADVTPQQGLLIWGFFTLSFLHAAHVLAGLVPLVVVTIRAARGRYSAGRCEGVHLVALYWHFLFVTWVAILAVLIL